MGYYGIYDIVMSFVGISLDLIKKTPTRLTMLWLYLFISVLVLIPLFILQGIGLYKMAKNRNLKHKILAFIPLANIYYIGKLAGKCSVFGQKVKNIGLYAMIAELLTLLLSGTIIAAELYLQTTVGDPMINSMYGTYWDVIEPGFAKTVSGFYNTVSILLAFIQLISAILMVILLSGLYKQYSPRQYFLFGFLSLMFPARYIIIFVLRKRKAIDYEAYVKARREAYIRQYQQRYGGQNSYNPYGNPNGNPYANPRPTGEPPKPEDPFEEFTSGNKEKGNDNQTEGEDFFN